MAAKANQDFEFIDVIKKEPPQFYRQKAIETMIPISGSNLWLLVDAGLFPAPVKLSANVTAWVSREVDAWCFARIAERDARIAVRKHREASNDSTVKGA